MKATCVECGKVFNRVPAKLTRATTGPTCSTTCRAIHKRNVASRKIFINENGYVCIGGNGTTFQHRVIVEEHLGRKLLPGEIVHHKDGDKTNNNIENLEVMCQSEHVRLHSPAGEKHPSSRFTDEMIIEMLDLLHLHGRKLQKVSVEYGISYSRLSSIKHGNLRREAYEKWKEQLTDFERWLAWYRANINAAIAFATAKQVYDEYYFCDCETCIARKAQGLQPTHMEPYCKLPPDRQPLGV